jgi:hypothetical protein
MAVSPNTDFTAGSIYTASQANNFPRGVMGYVVRSSGNVTVTTALADITGASVSFTAVANRGYKVTFTALVSKNTAAGYFNWFITDGANAVQNDGYMDIVLGKAISFSTSYVVTGLAAGAQTLKMRATTDTNNVTVFASGTTKYTFIVEDIGPV